MLRCLVTLCTLAVTTTYAVFFCSLLYVCRKLYGTSKCFFSKNCFKMLSSHIKCLEMPWETISFWSNPVQLHATSLNVNGSMESNHFHALGVNMGLKHVHKITGRGCSIKIGSRLPIMAGHGLVGLHLGPVWVGPLSSSPQDCVSPRCVNPAENPCAWVLPRAPIPGLHKNSSYNHCFIRARISQPRLVAGKTNSSIQSVKSPPFTEITIIELTQNTLTTEITARGVYPITKRALATFP